MNIHVKLFAMLRELKGISELNVEVHEGATVASLLELLFPPTKEGTKIPKTMLYAVNREYAPRGYELKDGDEVAFIPPVSGG